VAVLAVLLVLLLPRFQPATGTLLVAAAGRSAGSLSATPLMIHGGGQWVALGDVSGAVPAAPQERDIKAVALRVGGYDGVRLGSDVQSVSITIAAGQVTPLLLGIQDGRLIPGAAYAGNDEVNLGLGELGGKFVAMPPFELVDQAGRAFNPTTTSGKDLVIAAFHTTCHETCPLYTALFLQLAKRLPAGIALAQVTTDPSGDTQSVLSDYALRVGASWTFATGSAEALTAFWKPFGVQLASGDTHVSTLAIVDRHGYVRLVYRGVPDVGSEVPPGLLAGMSPSGLQQLASHGDGWGAPDVLKALLTIAGPRQSTPTPGGKAPPFTLTGTDGRKVTLAGLAGKPAVINFWATYCPPCRAEMPLLERQVGSQSGVQLVLVNEGDSSRAARDFLDSLGVRRPALLDTDLAVGHAYGAVALPTTVFIRADGTIAARHIGQLDAAVLASYVSNLVAQ
jgi:cytochrome oxidase Cu insertion factor (SCO1/SenC/PrrC family)